MGHGPASASASSRSTGSSARPRRRAARGSSDTACPPQRCPAPRWGARPDLEAALATGARMPTDVFSGRAEFELGGVRVELREAHGETEDQLFVWLPEARVLLCGDNYYRAFPNLYTLRGTRPRPVDRWIESLDRMRRLQPEVLVPSHTTPVRGRDAVARELRTYRDGIQWVRDAVVRGAKRGPLDRRARRSGRAAGALGVSAGAAPVVRASRLVGAGALRERAGLVRRKGARALPRARRRSRAPQRRAHGRQRARLGRGRARPARARPALEPAPVRAVAQRRSERSARGRAARGRGAARAGRRGRQLQRPRLLARGGARTRPRRGGRPVDPRSTRRSSTSSRWRCCSRRWGCASIPSSPSACTNRCASSSPTSTRATR